MLGNLIAHIMVDDKFTDIAIRQFENAQPGVHRYYVVDAALPLKHIKDSRALGLSSMECEKELSRPEISAVVFHTLPAAYFGLLKSIEKHKKVIWIGWGYDYYDRLLKSVFPQGLLLSETAKMAKPKLNHRLYNGTKSHLGGIAKKLGLRKQGIDSSVLNRVDYFSPVLDEEYRVAIRENEWFKPEFIPWNYGTIEDDFSLSACGLEALGDNILMGNSASWTNNHCDAFKLIRDQLDLGSRKVIVPLSYGDSDYRGKVIEVGEKILGDNFCPLIDFLPTEEYIKIIQSCSVVIMNHLRQQAMGNIIISTMLGAKVFLNSSSMLFKWLQDKGFVVGDVEYLDLDPLPSIVKKNNMEVFRRNWGRAVQKEKTMKLIELSLS